MFFLLESSMSKKEVLFISRYNHLIISVQSLATGGKGRTCGPGTWVERGGEETKPSREQCMLALGCSGHLRGQLPIEYDPRLCFAGFQGKG